ncbi:MAG: creatininase family protein [Rhodobacteraceae bacterium]|nr:creatininase family protein [Paracoccaceae bacterium]
MSFEWLDKRALDFKDIDPDKTIAVLPTAAIEQHGPHLPVGTDTIIGKGMLEEVKKIIPPDLDVRILPIQAIGKSNEHIWEVGTLTLTAETALKAWAEIGQSVARSGIKKLVIVNSHGGNLDLISIVARELRVNQGMFVVKCQWGNFGQPEGLFSEYEKQYGIHGGECETSLVLYFRSELVYMNKAIKFESSAEYTPFPPVGPISYGWIAKDLNPDGTVGDAHLASIEKGKLTAEYQARGFLALLNKVADTDISKFEVETSPRK